MSRGRPPGSPIRERIVEILNHLGSAHGYLIYQVYTDVYDDVSLRSIYYHLNKGEELGVFEMDKVEDEEGNYSWGTKAEKVYYTLADETKPKGDEKVRVYVENNDELETSD